jgi:hypothetical protein
MYKISCEEDNLIFADNKGMTEVKDLNCLPSFAQISKKKNNNDKKNRNSKSVHKILNDCQTIIFSLNC